MPKENHYWSGQTENDGQKPDLTITWGNNEVTLNEHPVDRSALNRLINNLRRARNKTYGKDT